MESINQGAVDLETERRGRVLLCIREVPGDPYLTFTRRSAIPIAGFSSCPQTLLAVTATEPEIRSRPRPSLYLPVH
jgi:hypothetical protein